MILTINHVSMDKFVKKICVLRSQLVGAEYYYALRALEFAKSKHAGTRKDGVTPEFDHQVSIALYALTLNGLIYREEVIATIMLHDVREDVGISDQEIRSIFLRSSDKADRVAVAVELLTKKYRGATKELTMLFEGMSQNPIASIVKGCDRSHNLQSMIGVFTREKQITYMDEVKTLFLPMLKKARRMFPEQVLAYENIKHMLRSQCELISAGNGI